MTGLARFAKLILILNLVYVHKYTKTNHQSVRIELCTYPNYILLS